MGMRMEIKGLSLGKAGFLLFLSFLISLFILSFCYSQSRNPGVYEKDSSANLGDRNKRREYSTGIRYGEEPVKGWWWYQDYYKDKSKEEERKPPLDERQNLLAEQGEKKQSNKTEVSQERSSDSKQKKFKPLNEYTYEELLRMPVSEFRELYNYYLELAVSNPTEENIFNFLNLQEVLVKKALAFTSAYQYVQQKYADYYSGGFYPIARPGIEALQLAKQMEIDTILKRVKDDFGLVLFVKKGCPYCVAQARIMDYIIAEGFKVRYVDVDEYPRFASEYGVEIVPTILLVHRSGWALPIGSGVISLDEIKRRIYGIWKIWSGNESPETYSLYLFERGTPLDPKVPPPLWRQNQKR